jgi:hypothetical protein
MSLFGDPYSGYGRRRRGYGGDSLLDEILLIDEIEDLEEGDFEGALEDEIIRDFL